MTNQAVGVSIIIPVRAPTRELAGSLPRLRAVEPQAEVLVCPDEITTGLPETVTVLPTGPRTPPEKRDIASRQARGEILAFLDDDAYPAPGWLEAALRHFADPNVGAVGGPAVTPPDDGLWSRASGAVLASTLGTGPARMRYQAVGGLREVDDWPSVNLLVRKEAFWAVGGFATTFWPGDDTKLCLELRRAGYRILYDPAVVAYHHRATTPLRHLRQVARYGLHRGHFARVHPETSRRFSYVLPSVFLLAVIVGALVAVRAPALRRPLALAAALVVGAVFIAGVVAAARARRPALALLVPPLLLATHLVYGAAFLRGLLSPRLKQYRRSER